MMSDSTTIDGTAVDKKTGKLVLLIREERPWTDPAARHRELAAKIKDYVRYIRSDAFARAHGRGPEDTIIRLVTRTAPPKASVGFLKKVQRELGKHSIGFQARLAKRGTTRRPTKREPPDEREPSEPGGAGPEPPTPAPRVRDRDRRSSVPDSKAPPPDAAEPAGRDAAPPRPGADERSADAAPSRPEDRPPEAPEIDAGPEHRPPDDSEAPTARPPVRPGPNLRRLDEDAEGELPPFFPEEEFGRAPPETVEEPVFLKGEPDEPPSEIVTPEAEEVPGIEPARPSLSRAALAALGSAVTAGLVWPLLAAAAGHSASALAAGVGVMVGLGVRFRGNGSSVAFRIVAALGSILGIALGAVLTAAVLTALDAGTGFAGLLDPFTDTAILQNQLESVYGWRDAIIFVVAFILAVVLSVPRSPRREDAPPEGSVS